MDYTLYNYRDENGIDLFQAIRTYNPKSFKYRRWDGKTWIWSISGVRKVLYNFEAMLASDYVFVVEGEKDVETMKAHGFVATTCAGGANSWLEGYNKYFKYKKVYIIPDNDPPGMLFAKTVACGIFPYAKFVKILYLPLLKDKEDVTDWFNIYHFCYGDLKNIILETNELINEDIIKIQKELNLSNGKKNRRASKPSVKYTNSPINKDDIDRARLYPIENLIEVNSNGKAQCINPKHNDEVYSMDCRNGYLWCYG